MAKTVGDQIHVIQLLIQLRTGPKQQIERQLRGEVSAQQLLAGQAKPRLLKTEQAFRLRHRQAGFPPFLGYSLRLRLK
ncbi:hypothetical protein D3C73_1435610 [compost metagenome]